MKTLPFFLSSFSVSVDGLRKENYLSAGGLFVRCGWFAQENFPSVESLFVRYGWFAKENSLSGESLFGNETVF